MTDCWMVEERDVRVEECSGLLWFELYDAVSGEVVADDTYGLFPGTDPGQVAPGAVWVVRHNPARPPVLPTTDPDGGTEDHRLVLTPGGAVCLDCPRQTVDEDGAPVEVRYEVTGDAPELTVAGTITARSGWSGTLVDGVLTAS